MAVTGRKKINLKKTAKNVLINGQTKSPKFDMAYFINFPAISSTYPDKNTWKQFRRRKHCVKEFLFQYFTFLSVNKNGLKFLGKKRLVYSPTIVGRESLCAPDIELEVEGPGEDDADEVRLKERPQDLGRGQLPRHWRKGATDGARMLETNKAF